MAEKKEKVTSMRPLTEAEIADLHGDDTPPAGYSNTTLNDTAEPPAAEEPGAVAPPAEPPAAAEPPAGDPPAAPPADGEIFERLEVELAKPEGKEDISKFSKTEKAYFHQMRRDRKARQKAEEERDQAAFNLIKTKKELEARPPVPKADPFEGKTDDDVLSVKEARELLAKLPKEEAPPAAPAAPAVSPQAKRYLAMCEKEAREAHPDDFDAAMELSDDLISDDQTALREIGERTARGENPALVMYETIKKHKDFNDLLPAAQTRYAARKAAAASPASPSAPAAPATPEDKAKIEKAKQAESALENNGKLKTTAHASSREGKPAEELTFDDLYKMSDLEFAKLPRSTRQRYLKQHGA